MTEKLNQDSPSKEVSLLRDDNRSLGEAALNIQTEAKKCLEIFRSTGELPDDLGIPQAMDEILAQEEAELLTKLEELETPETHHSREYFKNHVKSGLSRADFKQLAYQKRREDGYDDNVYGLANRFGEIDEPSEIKDQEEWISQTYQKDLKFIERNCDRFADYCRRNGNQEAADILRENAEKARERLESGGSVPYLDEDPGFPTTMAEQNLEFMHCYDLKSQILWEYDDITCRLYMCPRTDQMTELIDEFVNRCNEKRQNYYFKFALRSDRHDRFIIYANYDNIDNYLDILSEIKKDKPILFKDMEKGKNPFWGKIKGVDGIYFGEEPALYPRYFDRFVFGYSYTELLGNIFDNAFEKWGQKVYGEKSDEQIKEETGEWHLYNPTIRHFISPNEITDDEVDQFMTIFKDELEKSDIDPNNFAFDECNSEHRL